MEIIFINYCCGTGLKMFYRIIKDLQDTNVKTSLKILHVKGNSEVELLLSKYNLSIKQIRNGYIIIPHSPPLFYCHSLEITNNDYSKFFKEMYNILIKT